MKRRSSQPPVLWTGPPGKVSVYTENHSKQNNDQGHKGVADLSVFDIFENQIKSSIKNGCNNRIPGIFIHHCKAQNMSYPLDWCKTFSCSKTQNSINQNAYVIWNYESFYHALFHKAVKVVRLCFETFDKTKARAEKEDCYKKITGIYKNAEFTGLCAVVVCHLKGLLLRYMMKNYTNGRKAPQRHKRIQRG